MSLAYIASNPFKFIILTVFIAYTSLAFGSPAECRISNIISHRVNMTKSSLVLDESTSPTYIVGNLLSSLLGLNPKQVPVTSASRLC